LQQRIDHLNTALALEIQNAGRRPKIQKALNQNGIVRPRLTADDLTRNAGRQEAR
jgi:hypothetical protein